MNQFSSIDGATPFQRHRGVIGRLPLYRHVRGVSAFLVRPFVFFISAVATAAALYFFVLQAPIYTSDVQIGVRGRQALTTNPLFAALGGIQSGVPESTALAAFIESDGMLNSLEGTQHLRGQYSRFRVDFINHLPANASRRRFLRFFKSMVDVDLDSASNIIGLHVRGFDPQEARNAARAIVNNSVGFVGNLSAQMRLESTRAAQQDVTDAQRDAQKAHAALSAFQARSNRLDPGAFGMATNTSYFQLQNAIGLLRAQLASLRTYTTQRAPQVLQMQAQIASLEAQQRELQQRMTGQQGKATVVSQLGTFQRLTLDQQYADQRLTVAQAALDQARSVAQQRQLFIVPIIGPTLPDEPTPRRWWGFFTVLAIATTLYVIGRLTLASIRDHQV